MEKLCNFSLDIRGKSQFLCSLRHKIWEALLTSTNISYICKFYKNLCQCENIKLLPGLEAAQASERPWRLSFIGFKDSSLLTVLQSPDTIGHTLWMLKEILWSEFMNSSSQYLQSSVISIIFELLMSLSVTWCWTCV